MDCNPPLILASASPRRRELLNQIGLEFGIQPVDLDETPLPDELPGHYVERLARAKAAAGLEKADQPEALVLGADTSVVLDDRILGKPGDRGSALAMLRQLSGRTHKVFSAVALAGGHGCYARITITEVCFRDLEDAEMERYWETGEPRDKAGAYGIQGYGAVFVTGIWGSYSGVVGLPLQETAELLREAGVPVWQSWRTDS